MEVSLVSLFLAGVGKHGGVGEEGEAQADLCSPSLPFHSTFPSLSQLLLTPPLRVNNLPFDIHHLRDQPCLVGQEFRGMEQGQGRPTGGEEEDPDGT